MEAEYDNRVEDRESVKAKVPTVWDLWIGTESLVNLGIPSYYVITDGHSIQNS